MQAHKRPQADAAEQTPALLLEDREVVAVADAAGSTEQIIHAVADAVASLDKCFYRPGDVAELDLTITGVGARASLPNFSELSRRYRELYRREL